MRRFGKILLGLVVLALLAGGGYVYWRYQQDYPSTDDAYVNAHVVRIAAQLAGTVAAVPVRSFQTVAEGDLLVEIDPQPFRLALAAAEADLALAQQQAAAAAAAVDAAQALVAQRQATLDDTRANSQRVLVLVNKGELPRAQGDDANAQLREAEAALASARADLRQAERELGNPGVLNARVRAAQAAVDRAKLDLSYTRITAPVAGTLGEIDLRPGAMVLPGQALLPLVEANSFWVDANFKETDLARIRPGMPAAVAVDLYPNQIYRGTVEALSPASGVAFSLLPAQNATGNWVKVTQRFPIRVKLDGLDSAGPTLRVGASSSVTVDTTARP